MLTRRMATSCGSEQVVFMDGPVSKHNAGNIVQMPRRITHKLKHPRQISNANVVFTGPRCYRKGADSQNTKLRHHYALSNRTGLTQSGRTI